MTPRPNLAFSILFLLISAGSIAQTQQPYRAAGEHPTEGTPYMEDAYAKGTVYLKEQSNIVELRYNIYADRMEFKSGGSVKSLSPDPLVRKVILGKLTFVPEQYLLKGQLTNGFFINLDSGKIGIFRKLNIVLTAFVQPTPLQDAKPETFERRADTYYVKIGTQVLVEIRSVKKLIQTLPDHQEEMEVFAKKEKISADDPEELVKFSRYYQSLQ